MTNETNPTPSPAALAAVGEFDTALDILSFTDNRGVKRLSEHSVRDWLLAALARVEAEARREERERVWRLAVLVSSTTPTGGDITDIVGVINDAAIEDLATLTQQTNHADE